MVIIFHNVCTVVKNDSGTLPWEQPRYKDSNASQCYVVYVIPPSLLAPCSLYS